MSGILDGQLVNINCIYWGLARLRIDSDLDPMNAYSGFLVVFNGVSLSGCASGTHIMLA